MFISVCACLCMLVGILTTQASQTQGSHIDNNQGLCCQLGLECHTVCWQDLSRIFKAFRHSHGQVRFKVSENSLGGSLGVSPSSGNQWSCLTPQWTSFSWIQLCLHSFLSHQSWALFKEIYFYLCICMYISVYVYMCDVYPECTSTCERTPGLSISSEIYTHCAKRMGVKQGRRHQAPALVSTSSQTTSILIIWSCPLGGLRAKLILFWIFYEILPWLPIRDELYQWW